MNDMTLLYIVVGSFVAAISFFVSRVAVGSNSTKLRDRLSSDGEGKAAETEEAGGLMPLLERIGTAAAEPFMPKSREKQSTMRKNLGYAGVYSASAAKLVTGAKLICMISGLIIGYVGGICLDNIMLYLPLGGLVGYFMPKMWLKSRINKNQKAITQGLPDALDLMVVCVEAGLTIDAAMQRVGQELSIAHGAISREFGIAHMETRVGLSRQESLRNLGVRTGNAALQSLASMLVQADRFGTSIAGALRIHADSLRVKRQQAAEEIAAKASVKMSFPLVLFIFPSTFIVLAGPTVIGLMKSALFNE